MTWYHDQISMSTIPVRDPVAGTATLVVGDVSRWKSEGRNMPQLCGVQFIGLGDLTETTLCATHPAIILSPLVADDFDVLDVAQRLASLGFLGRYRAISEGLFDPELIREEVRSFAPQLDFDLVVMPVAVNQE